MSLHYTVWPSSLQISGGIESQALSSTANLMGCDTVQPNPRLPPLHQWGTDIFLHFITDSNEVSGSVQAGPVLWLNIIKHRVMPTASTILSIWTCKSPREKSRNNTFTHIISREWEELWERKTQNKNKWIWAPGDVRRVRVRKTSH